MGSRLVEELYQAARQADLILDTLLDAEAEVLKREAEVWRELREKAEKNNRDRLLLASLSEEGKLAYVDFRIRHLENLMDRARRS